MTIQTLNTKAEQAILKSFHDNAGLLPGGSAVAELRRAAIGVLQSKGLPSRRVEEFKYSDLKANLKEALPLATGGSSEATTGDVLADLGTDFPAALLSGATVFAGGRGLSTGAGVTLISAQGAATVPWVASMLADEALTPPDIALNTALFTDGAVIDVAEGAAPDAPIVIVSAGEAGSMVALRHLVRIGKGAKVTLVEIERAPTTAGPRQMSTLTQIVVGDGAEVSHIRVTETVAGAFELGHWQVDLGANAVYRPFHMTAGEGFVRNSINIAFQGPHSTFDFGGALIVHGQGHADSTLVIDHKVPHCTSRELFKAVLDGQARAVFQGKVIVRPDAQKTDGKQMAQALMLSPDAEFDSKPELEIYADDVACGHGSTAAEIDPDLVFYCMSRGIPAAEARALLIESFIVEVTDKVENEALREALSGIARDRLASV